MGRHRISQPVRIVTPIFFFLHQEIAGYGPLQSSGKWNTVLMASHWSEPAIPFCLSRPSVSLELQDLQFLDEKITLKRSITCNLLLSKSAIQTLFHWRSMTCNFLMKKLNKDKRTDVQTSQLLDRIRPVCWFCEKKRKYFIGDVNFFCSLNSFIKSSTAHSAQNYNINKHFKYVAWCKKSMLLHSDPFSILLCHVREYRFSHEY